MNNMDVYKLTDIYAGFLKNIFFLTYSEFAIRWTE